MFMGAAAHRTAKEKAKIVLNFMLLWFGDVRVWLEEIGRDLKIAEFTKHEVMPARLYTMAGAPPVDTQT